ncbi:hypothetical protein K7432_009471 [Basidiobolus ranarum]|uniref:Uncharacterized protein n=1 Tax=Basidiobolus ranarum TaxID=34480 RepID=A0ABR2WQ62_9FUNG
MDDDQDDFRELKITTKSKYQKTKQKLLENKENSEVKPRREIKSNKKCLGTRRRKVTKATSVEKEEVNKPLFSIVGTLDRSDTYPNSRQIQRKKVTVNEKVEIPPEMTVDTSASLVSKYFGSTTTSLKSRRLKLKSLHTDSTNNRNPMLPKVSLSPKQEDTGERCEVVSKESKWERFLSQDEATVTHGFISASRLLADEHEVIPQTPTSQLSKFSYFSDDPSISQESEVESALIPPGVSPIQVNDECNLESVIPTPMQHPLDDELINSDEQISQELISHTVEILSNEPTATLPTPLSEVKVSTCIHHDLEETSQPYSGLIQKEAYESLDESSLLLPLNRSPQIDTKNDSSELNLTDEESSGSHQRDKEILNSISPAPIVSNNDAEMDRITGELRSIDDREIQEQNTDVCPICQRSLLEFQSVQAKENHVNRCLDVATQSSPSMLTLGESQASITSKCNYVEKCMICQENISYMTEYRKSQHINTCLDGKQQEKPIKTEPNVIRQQGAIVTTSQPDNKGIHCLLNIPNCPSCQNPWLAKWTTIEARVFHLKCCAKLRKLTYSQLIIQMNQLGMEQSWVAESPEESFEHVQEDLKQRRSREFQVAFLEADEDFTEDVVIQPLPNITIRKARKIKPESDEDLQYALAMSTSLYQDHKDVFVPKQKRKRLDIDKIPTRILPPVEAILYSQVKAEPWLAQTGDLPKPNSHGKRSDLKWWNLQACDSNEVSDTTFTNEFFRRVLRQENYA